MQALQISRILSMARLSLLLIFFPAIGFSKNYYISSSGNDGNSGLSPQLAWQTISKLNAAFNLVQPGDSILFKRGDSFFGSVIVSKSGVARNPIVFAAYGQGDDPVITGFTTISGWRKNGFIWEAAAPGVKPNLNMVTLDGAVQQIGRYPNANGPDGGFRRYENCNGSKSITDSELTNDIDWTGAEVIIRKNHWTAERCRVTKQDGNTIFYTYATNTINLSRTPLLYDGTKGNGYFFQKSRRTLDQDGEWFFDSTNGKLQLFFSKGDLNEHKIRASIVDTLVSSGNASYLVFNHLIFEGCNLSGIFNKGGGHITVQHCSFNKIGAKAIHYWNTGDVVIDHVSTNFVLSNAIQIRNTEKDNSAVTNCVVKNTGTIMGMGSFFDGRDYKGIDVITRSNTRIENNIVDSTGLSGIQFQGNDVVIQHNFINNYCLKLDDGGGIYTFIDADKEHRGDVFTNRLIKENVIINGAGNTDGSTGIAKAEGIYLDRGSMNVTCTGNTVANISNKAFAFNNPTNLTIRDNTCFNTGGGWGATRYYSWQSFGGCDIKHNIFFAMNDKQRQVEFNFNGLKTPDNLSIWEAMKLMGDIDSNYYNSVNPFGFVYTFSQIEDGPFIYPSPLTFEHWQEFSDQDAHSKKPAKIYPRFNFRKKINENLVKNGAFSKDLSEVKVFGESTRGVWDNAGKVSGEGSLRIEFDVPRSHRYTQAHSPVGTLTAGKKYILKFNTVGTSDCGIVRGYARKTTPPYTTLTDVQAQPFGTTKLQHEFLLQPTATTEASYVIEVERNSCTTYIDDIELYEADATSVDVKDHVRFEYNSTDKPVQIALDRNYTGVDGTAYSGTLTLPPYSSKILLAAQ